MSWGVEFNIEFELELEFEIEFEFEFQFQFAHGASLKSMGTRCSSAIKDGGVDGVFERIKRGKNKLFCRYDLIV